MSQALRVSPSHLEFLSNWYIVRLGAAVRLRAFLSNAAVLVLHPRQMADSCKRINFKSLLRSASHQRGHGQPEKKAMGNMDRTSCRILKHAEPSQFRSANLELLTGSIASAESGQFGCSCHTSQQASFICFPRLCRALARILADRFFHRKAKGKEKKRTLEIRENAQLGRDAHLSRERPRSPCRLLTPTLVGPLSALLLLLLLLLSVVCLSVCLSRHARV